MGSIINLIGDFPTIMALLYPIPPVIDKGKSNTQVNIIMLFVYFCDKCL